MLGMHQATQNTIQVNNNELQSQNKALRHEVEILKSSNTEKDKKIDLLTSRIEKLESYSRYPNVVVSGIPENDDEKLYSWFYNDFLKKADLHNRGPGIQPLSVDKIHRIPKHKPVQRPSSPSPP